MPPTELTRSITPLKSTITKWAMGIPKVLSIVWTSGPGPSLNAVLILLSVARPLPDGMSDSAT
jgi:hypothetical protein